MKIKCPCVGKPCVKNIVPLKNGSQGFNIAFAINDDVQLFYTSNKDIYARIGDTIPFFEDCQICFEFEFNKYDNKWVCKIDDVRPLGKK